MIVRSSCPGIEAPTHVEDARVGRTELRDETSTSLQSIGDRSVISHRARKELDEIRKSPESNGRIKALLNTTQLTVQQAEELMARIREGYYRRPEILRTMAAMVCSVLEAEP